MKPYGYPHRRRMSDAHGRLMVGASTERQRSRELIAEYMDELFQIHGDTFQALVDYDERCAEPTDECLRAARVALLRTLEDWVVVDQLNSV